MVQYLVSLHLSASAHLISEESAAVKETKEFVFA